MNTRSHVVTFGPNGPTTKGPIVSRELVISVVRSKYQRNDLHFGAKDGSTLGEFQMSVVLEKPEIKRGQVWENKKLGMDYEVLSVGICCDKDKNNQQSVIYTKNGEVYTRCRDEFLQCFVQVR